MGGSINRAAIADHIVERLAEELPIARSEFGAKGRIPACQVQNLLPPELARNIFRRFPDSTRMILKRSIKENKHIAAQMNAFEPLIEEAVYAFQDPRVVRLIAEITGLEQLEPDVDLYAGGISAMSKGAYLRPHLDNSHDKDRDRYRVLNLLYYVTPDWQEDYGGSLQVWDFGPTGSPRSFPCFFNSLLIMATGKNSWHSVNEIRHDGAPRRCVSNYYFSRRAPEAADYFHATSFRSEYGKGALDLVMRADNLLRTTILKALPGVYRNPHVYKRQSASAE